MLDRLMLWLLACAPPAPEAPPPAPEAPAAPTLTPPRVHVDRAARTVTVVDRQGHVTVEPIGIGSGGLAEKRSMADRVTPTGTFTVDLVLHAAGTHDAVAPEAVARFAGDPELAALLTPDGLPRLFRNMSGLDFDGDGAAGEYGPAYIGLHAADVVTGPKLDRWRGVPRWFSIALHGTPDPTDLGGATSGGCVHLSDPLLARLIEEELLVVGSTVTITDGPP